MQPGILQGVSLLPEDNIIKSVFWKSVKIQHNCLKSIKLESID